jgi:uncharacterized protein YndB with AHSA1/START domain
MIGAVKLNVSAVKTTEIEVTRTIPATPSAIFDLWIDPKSPGSPWFGAARAIVQPVLDGLFYHVVHFEGRDWAHYGRFTVLSRPQCIEHTWVSEATRGLESLVRLTLEPQDNQTLLKLRQTNVPNDEMGRRHEAGWGFVIAAIVERFQNR